MERRALVVIAGMALATAARAEMPARLVVVGGGDCPTAAEVARALGKLHPAVRVTVAGGEGARVEVSDRGGAYEVRAGDKVRRSEDAARRCGERATAAAVAVTLMLDPPVAPPPEEPEGPLAPRSSEPATAPAPATTTAPPPTTPSPPTTPAPTATAPVAPVPPVVAPAPTIAPAPAVALARPRPKPGARALRLELELGGIVDGAPAIGDAAAEASGGAALRLAVGGRNLAGTIGVEGLAPVDANTAGVTVNVTRVPIDAGVRLALPLGRWELGGDVGVSLAILRLSAPALADATSSTRLDVGARLAPWLRLGISSRVAVQLGVQMVVSFAPYDLVVAPLGKIGTTPRVWLGAGLGLVVRL